MIFVFYSSVYDRMALENVTEKDVKVDALSSWDPKKEFDISRPM